MGKHFISILGTGLYEPVSYDGQPVDSFIQMALLRKYHDILAAEDSSISIFLTSEARKANWEDHPYTSIPQAVSKWPESVRPQVGDVKKGLCARIHEEFPDLVPKIHEVDIPNGKHPSDIWDIFSAFYDSFEENDEILFDITHSFRYIPMLAITVINYARVMKNCSLKGIFYGAYEAYDGTDENGFKNCPIIDLTVYNEILKWTHAADTLTRYGDPSEMAEIINTKKRDGSIPKSEFKDWKPFTDHIGAMSDLSAALSSCRGASAETVMSLEGRNKTKIQCSIQAAYQRVKSTSIGEASSAESTNGVINSIVPAAQLLEKAEAAYDQFDVAENYQVGMAAVKWDLDHDMIEQGFTALEETAKTFVCYLYDLPDTDERYRDGIAGGALSSLAIVVKNKKDYGNIDISLSLTDDRNPIDSEAVIEKVISIASNSRESAYSRLNQEEKDQFREIVAGMPLEYAGTTDTIKSYRNDINHFGMRKKPQPPKSLKEYLEKAYEKMSAMMEELDQKRKSGQKS